jgi:hypothetical protein
VCWLAAHDVARAHARLFWARESPTKQMVTSLPIPRPSCSSRASFFLTRKRSVNGIRVPSLSLVMPDHRREIEPDDSILRTMLLRLGFVGKCLERERRNRERQTDD